jgi:hypothetical protein
MFETATMAVFQLRRKESRWSQGFSIMGESSAETVNIIHNYFIIMLHIPGCSCIIFFSTVTVHLRILNTSSAYSDRAYRTARTVHTAHYRYNSSFLRSPGCRKPGCNVCRRAWHWVCASSNGQGKIRRRYSSLGVSFRKGSVSGRLGTWWFLIEAWWY